MRPDNQPVGNTGGISMVTACIANGLPVPDPLGPDPETLAKYGCCMVGVLISK